MNKSIHFILDELKLNKPKDIDTIEEFLIFNNSFFTETRVKLTDYEKSFLKKFSNINFV